MTYCNYNYKYNRENCWYLNICSEKDNMEKCNMHCPRYFKMDYLMFASNIPKNLQKGQILKTPKIDQEVYEQLANIKRDLINFVSEGKSLYLYSQGFGNGKTSWALKLLKSYFDLIWPSTPLECRGLFISVPIFMRKYKDQFKEDSYDSYFSYILSQLPDADIVVWDDIGFANMSDADFKMLSSYIEERILRGLSNFYTANLNETDLEQKLGLRLKSRIWNNSIKFQFKGIDCRVLKK